MTENGSALYYIHFHVDKQDSSRDYRFIMFVSVVYMRLLAPRYLL